MRRCVASLRGRVPYREALAQQRLHVARLQRGEAGEELWFVEHDHVVTMGRNATRTSLLVDRATLEERGVDLVETDRGGDLTYHGPGQLVGYPLLELEATRRDIRRYVHDLEDVLIRTLAEYDIAGGRHPVHRGVWVEGRKIASLGIRISRWVTSHGFALNVTTDLSYFSLIDPCGIVGCEMTSMAAIAGSPVDAGGVVDRLAAHFAGVFEREVVFEAMGALPGGAHGR